MQNVCNECNIFAKTKQINERFLLKHRDQMNFTRINHRSLKYVILLWDHSLPVLGSQTFAQTLEVMSYVYQL